MQSLNQQATNIGGEKSRERVEKVVETLATLRYRGENLAEVAHDARNMVTALGLYCDLLEEPGVLAVPFAHYAQELRLVAAASRQLVEELMALDVQSPSEGSAPRNQDGRSGEWPGREGPSTTPSAWHSANAAGGNNAVLERSERLGLQSAVPVSNVAAELLANRNLLSALAGPSIALTMDAAGGAQPVRLTGEDLTRVLVNVVKNSAEAMPGGGRIHIRLNERPAANGATARVTLTIEDNGPGIPEGDLDRIFTSGYTTRGRNKKDGSWPINHHGLGLAVTRSIVEQAGGRVLASNRQQGGALFRIELPVQKNGVCFQNTRH
jgi:signal transduction histidine kinase